MITSGQIGNVDLVKQLNSAIVYRLIDKAGPISRIQIAEQSQLAPASVTKITRQLLERGLIKEVAQQASTGGRRAISLMVESTPFHAIAVRLGRDYLDITLYDLSGNALVNTTQVFKYKTQQELVTGLLSQIDSFVNQHTLLIKEWVALGLTLPGLIEPETGTVDYMPNIDVHQLSLAQILSERFAVLCFIGNDIRGLALAEHYFGATKSCQDSILVSVHHGTGAGIIVNGEVFLGHNRNVGEIGHIQIDPLGLKCQCGNFGCLETVASEPAILAQVRERLKQDYPSKLQHVSPLSIFALCQAAQQQDELAKQLLIQVGQNLGKALAMTVNLFNPQKIVLAGHIVDAQAIIFPAIRQCIETQSLHNFHQNLPIVASETYKQPTLGAFAMIKRAMLNGVLLQRLLDQSQAMEFYQHQTEQI
jgi:N-acetylglucosamine repressor